MPSSSEEQKVSIVRRALPPTAKINREKKYGNRVLFVKAPAGKDGTITLSVTYRVTRKEIRGPVGKEPRNLASYLQANALVPITGEPLKLLKGQKLPRNKVLLARALYDLIHRHMIYDLMPLVTVHEVLSRAGQTRRLLGLSQWARQLHGLSQLVHLSRAIPKHSLQI